MSFRILQFEEIDSTNKEIKRAIDAGCTTPINVRSYAQSAGYGRQARSWQSPFGGAYQSFLLDFDTSSTKHLPTLSLALGSNIHKALQELTSLDAAKNIKIKWPNDIVYVHDKQPVNTDFAASHPFYKLAGISAETYKGKLCIGVGVNVFYVECCATTKNQPIFLSQLGLMDKLYEVELLSLKHTISNADRNVSLNVCVNSNNKESTALQKTCINKVQGIVSDAVIDAYTSWKSEGIDPFLSDLNLNNALLGRHVSVENMSKNSVATGEVGEILSDGRLVLHTLNNSDVLLSSGEVHITST